MNKIKIGVMGYGNLGRGVELAVRQNPDMELAAFFTRRDPKTLKTLSPDVPVYNVSEAAEHKDEVDSFTKIISYQSKFIIIIRVDLCNLWEIKTYFFRFIYFPRMIYFFSSHGLHG